jgi:hypothetical protein
MKQDIEDHIRKCELCGINKHVNHPNKAPPAKMSVPEKPLDEAMIDFVGPFQAASTHKFRYVLQIQDILSRFIVFVPCINATAQTAVDAMLERWLCIFGMPEIIRSDRGPHFVAEVFKGLCRSVGIEHHMGAPEHPESQGQVERQNQLVNQVRCLCENDVEKWPEAISKVQFSHNASINASTGFTPAKLLLGKEFKLPDDFIAKEKMVKKKMSPAQLLEVQEEERLIQISQAKKNIDAAQEKRIARMENHEEAHPYRLGDHVRYKLNADTRSQRGGKISPRYSDVYEIAEVKANEFTYLIKPVGSSRGQQKIRHFNDLKTVERVDQSGDMEGMEDVDGDAPNPQGSNVTVRSDQTGVGDALEVPVSSLPVSTNDNRSTGARRSRRDRKQTMFMQADGNAKTYSESAAQDDEGDFE